METEGHLPKMTKADYLRRIKEILIKKNIFNDDNIDEVLSLIENGSITAYLAKNQSNDQIQITRERQISAIGYIENILTDLGSPNINHEVIEEEIEKLNLCL